MKSYWFLQYILRARLFRAQQTTTKDKKKNNQNATHEHGKITAPATDRASKKKQQKRNPNLNKKRPKNVSFPSLVPDRRRDRLGDLKKHPRERQKALRERPKRPQGLPRGPPDPPGASQNDVKCNGRI